MVLLRVCDDSGRIIPPLMTKEKKELWNQSITHAKLPDGTIDWAVF